MTTRGLFQQPLQPVFFLRESKQAGPSIKNTSIEVDFALLTDARNTFLRVIDSAAQRKEAGLHMLRKSQTVVILSEAKNLSSISSTREQTKRDSSLRSE
jgi:hypothetical protein